MRFEINNRVRFFRKKLGLRQIDIAEKLGKKSSTYSQCERESKITCEMIIALAEILRVDVRILLYGEIPEVKLPKVPEPEFSKTEKNIVKIIRNL